MTSVLRQRGNSGGKKKADQLERVDEFEQSFTQIPGQPNDMDYTTIPSSSTKSSTPKSAAPTAEETKEQPKDLSSSNNKTLSALDSSSSSFGGDSSAKNYPSSSSPATVTATTTSSDGGPRKAMTGEQVAKDESRLTKFLVRLVSAIGMIAVFVGCVYSGHIYTCWVVALSEFLLFRELVKVRYNTHFHMIEDTIPLFRTTQWIWFGVAIFYTYGDFVSEVIQNNSQLHYLWPYSKYMPTISFALYSATFVLTIATMQVGHIKFQLNQLCWTIVVLCLTVGQMKYIMHNIFNGLFWFTFPFLLVVTNDIMAYFAGVTCGRKFIQRPFISFSPNKTWEGFIGGGIFTMIAAWYLSRTLAQYSWMTCPVTKFDELLMPEPLECENHHIFQQAQSIFSSQLFDLFPHSLVKMYIPNITEICSDKTTGELQACVSGSDSQQFDHFELVLKNVIPIQIHALWLAFFASVVGPFGGFLASAIKRAYGIKDFDSLIPGHGGVTDRLDCQFLMALCTWVHYNTFVKMATVSVPKLVYMYHMLNEQEQKSFIEEITKRT